jgi:hypothetical protein
MRWLVPLLLVTFPVVAHGQDIPKTHSLEISVTLPVSGSVEMPSGDNDGISGLALDSAVMWRLSPGFQLGATGGYLSWSNDDTEAIGGGSSGLVRLGGLARYAFGAARFKPFLQAGLGLGVSSLADGFVLERTTSSDTVYVIHDEPGYGVTFEGGAGFRIELDGVHILADFSLRGASLYHRMSHMNGSFGGESDEAVLVGAYDLRAGIAFPF